MGSTIIGGVTYPEGTDQPVIPSQLRQSLEEMNRNGVPRFANSTARTAAYATLGISPNKGALSYTEDTDLYSRYTSTAWVPLGAQVVARAKRSAAKSGISVEVGVVRLDSIAIGAGRIYRVTTGTIGLNSSVNEAAQISALLRVDTTGASATTASTALGFDRAVTQAGSGAGAGLLEFHYYAAAAVTMSVLLTVVRGTGAGTITCTGPDGVLGPEILVEDLGLTVTATGVDI